MLGLLAAVSLLGILFYAIRTTTFPAAEQAERAEDNTLEIGKLLFTQHVIPFELVSVLLTVAFIGSIVLTGRRLTRNAAFLSDAGRDPVLYWALRGPD